VGLAAVTPAAGVLVARWLEELERGADVGEVKRDLAN